MIGDDQAGGGEAFSLESGEATVVVQMAWGKVRSFLRYALGFSYADAGAPWRLRRENPVFHPRYPWLTATTVTFSAKAPEPNATDDGTFTAGIYPDAQNVAEYQIVYATVRFTDRPWSFLEDDEMVASGADGATAYLLEPTRNTYFNPAPTVEIISAEGLNNISFANGTPAYPDRTAAIPAPFGTLMSKCNLAFRWMWVPNEYVSGPSPLAFTPKWIEDCTGCVNSADFLGYPAGTLLLQAPSYERFRFPMAVAGGGSNKTGFFGWNITLNMQFFDPNAGGDEATVTTRGSDTFAVLTFVNALHGTYPNTTSVTVDWTAGGTTHSATGTITGSTPTALAFTATSGDALPIVGTAVTIFDNRYRGHQLVPKRSDLFWYGAIRSDGSSKLYPEANFYDIFKHVGTFGS